MNAYPRSPLVLFGPHRYKLCHHSRIAALTM